MKNSHLWTNFLIVFVELLGFSLIFPLLPYYAKTFGANPVIVGLLVTSYATALLIAAPLLGRLWDRKGNYFGRWAPGIFAAFLLIWAVSFDFQRIVIPTRRARLEVEIEVSHA